MKRLSVRIGSTGWIKPVVEVIVWNLGNLEIKISISNILSEFKNLFFNKFN